MLILEKFIAASSSLFDNNCNNLQWLLECNALKNKLLFHINNLFAALHNVSFDYLHSQVSSCIDFHLKVGVNRRKRRTRVSSD